MNNNADISRSKQLGTAIRELAKLPTEDGDFLKLSSSHSVFNEDVEPALRRPIDRESDAFKFDNKLAMHLDSQLSAKFKDSLVELAIYSMQSADVDFKGILEDIQSGAGVVFADVEDLNKSREQLATAGVVLNGTTVQLSLQGYPSEIINEFEREQLSEDKKKRKQFYLAFENVSGNEKLGTTYMKRRVYVDF